MAYIHRKDLRKEVASDIRTIFNAPDRPTAEFYLKKYVEKYHKIASKLAEWMENNIPEGFTVFDFPQDHRRRIRTSNYLERVKQEIKRRTIVVRIFSNEDSCLRLISAILMELDEYWKTGKKYLSINKDVMT
jgi:putative transposase